MPLIRLRARPSDRAEPDGRTKWPTDERSERSGYGIDVSSGSWLAVDAEPDDGRYAVIVGD